MSDVKSLLKMIKLSGMTKISANKPEGSSYLRHGTQHSDIQHNDIQHNDIQHHNKKNATLNMKKFSIMVVLLC